MFDRFDLLPGDPLLSLTGQFQNDPRNEKIDVGVGVYRDATGATPVMGSVKSAEISLLAGQKTKAYISPEGDAAFLDRLGGMILGVRDFAGIQTPGGTGALSLAARLLFRAGTRRIWIGLPTWANHAAVFEDAGLEVRGVPIFDAGTQKRDHEAFFDALRGAESGDAVLLHACCHNPTGSDPNREEWIRMARALEGSKLVPLIDAAYIGFGDGFAEDTSGLREILNSAPGLVAVSCSKNFGLYRERTGALFAVGERSDVRSAVSHLVHLARGTYSMPPAHGAEVVRTILTNPDLRADWRDEVEAAAGRIRKLREALSDALARHWPEAVALARQRGMFSLLPLTPGAVRELRDAHGIYMPESGRINVAGLGLDQIEPFADAVAPKLGL